MQCNVSIYCAAICLMAGKTSDIMHYIYFIVRKKFASLIAALLLALNAFVSSLLVSIACFTPASVLSPVGKSILCSFMGIIVGVASD